MTLYEALQKWDGEPPLIEADRAFSAESLLADYDKLAADMASAGCPRVVVRSPSVKDHVVAIAAAQKAGISLFLAHAHMPDTALAQFVERYHIDASLEGAALCKLPPAGTAPKDKDPLVYIMTSGTTGAPKVAAHTFESLSGAVRRTESSKSARWLMTFPVSSFAGLQVLFTSVLGGGVLISPCKSHPEAFVDAARQQMTTHISGTPSFWRAFLMALGEHDLPRLRQITLGGEPADQPTLTRLSSRFPGARIAHIYASTEAGALLSVTDGREGFPAVWLADGVGEARLRITEGMLEVFSPRRMIGYVSGDAESVTDDGWIRTKDLVRIEGDRVLFVGRSDSRLNIGGYKVAAEEVERALLSVAGIADARVTGVLSPLTGQALVAEVLYAPAYNPDEVRKRAVRYLKENLEPYKVPRLFRAMQDMPLTASGKKARRL